MSNSTVQEWDEEAIGLLCCPVTRSRLRLVDGFLVGEVGGLKYPIRNGIPALLAEEARLPEGVASLEEFREKFGAR
jgi:uncharacterized protein YbaR (Trm112 family)